MKKLLLFAASALMGLSSAFAQAYITGASISDPADIQDDAIYFLHAIQPNRGNRGFVQGFENLQDQTFAKFGDGFTSEITEAGETNSNYLWQFKRITEGEYAGNFIIKMQNADRWFSKMGSVAVGKNKTQKVNSENDANIGIFALETPTEYSQGNNKFWFRLNNAYPATATNTVLATHKICMRSNNSGNTELMAYWHTDESSKDFYVQFEIIEAIEKQATPRTVSVTYPDINGWPVNVADFELYDGQNAALTIKNKLAELGGMANAVITSNKADDSENMTVADDNLSFTVTGTWDRQLIANHVYRLCVKPNDKPASMRYEPSTGFINNVRDANQDDVFTRIIPERFWFFQPVEGKTDTYTLHTLGATNEDGTYKAVYIEDYKGSGYKKATLADAEHPATEFKVGKSTWQVSNNIDNYVGDIYLSYGANNANYINDRSGYLAHWADPAAIGNNGSAIRLYPMLADDFDALGIDATEPTVQNVGAAILAYNSTDLDAALRRVRYLGSSNDHDLIGDCVGQYNNEKGDAAELYARAKAIINGEEEADEATKQKIVDGLYPTNLTMKELVPNRFYRFKNKVSNKYISSISSHTVGNVKLMDLTEDGTRSNTVFLYHQEGEGDATVNTLVCFDDGKVMSNFVGSDWTPVVKGSENAGLGTELVYQNNGRYVIHVDGTGTSHRHLYGAELGQHGSGIVDASGNSTDNNHQWFVEEVTELPVTFFNVVDEDPNHDDDGWSSVCVPVALELSTDSHITAYTGTFVQNVNADKGDVQHILATEIPSVDGKKVTIPAGQVALLYYDGGIKDLADDNYDYSAMQATRGDIIYARIPINYDYEGELTEKGNLTGGYFAFNQEENKEYYTLHASYNNYFRQLSSYKDGYFDFVPGFKAYLEVDPDNTEFYQVSAINPNGIVPEVTGAAGAQGLTVDKGSEEGKHQVTVTLDRSDYVVYYKHTPYPTEENADQPMSVRRRAEGDLKAGQTEGFSEADHVEGSNEHTFVVEPGSIEYYAYHPASNTTGAVRSFEITEKGDAVSTSLKSVLVNMNGKQVIFDLQGRRMGAPVKGVSIINGKKTYVK